jgi:NACalpha-BTF3-like transcription factor
VRAKNASAVTILLTAGANANMLAETEYGMKTAYHYAQELGHTACVKAIDRFENREDESQFEEKVQLLLTQHPTVTRAVALEALAQSDDDVVDALLLLSDEVRRKSMDPQDLARSFADPMAAEKTSSGRVATKVPLRDGLIIGGLVVATIGCIYYLKNRKE